MGKLIDLTGQRFGRLVVIERAENKGEKVRWLCQCDCGNTVLVATNGLRNGGTKSCGCLHKELFTHKSHNGTKTRLYRIWCGMKNRCYNKKVKSYDKYGGSGITVCAEWLHDFGAFQEWALSHGYADNLSIDRIDNEKGYSSDNCRWATAVEQNNNRRKFKKRQPKTE